MLKISGDAGHAGFGVTPGKRALDGSMYEWDFNNGCIKHFMDELSHYEGVAVLRVDDPTGKRDVPLSERAKRVNDWGSNLHISFHGNAGQTTAHGIETFVYPSASAHNREVALTIHNHVINATGRRNRGLKTADFYILRETNMDALLIEGGFMTNAEELALMKTDAYRSKVGRAVAAGVVQAYGLKRRAEQTMSEIVYIQTGGHVGQGLLNVHNYIYNAGHGYDVKRAGDGSLVFLVGPYESTTKNFTDSLAELKKLSGSVKVLTRDQASTWR